ncbi:MAG: gamma-glutamylcyclotransferase, partial [Myxococcales bacterium]|nr:gamma-glutamylcyclotransferase [Myxococcales bacterium]
MFIFVYGTLMRGEHAEHHLADLRCEGPARTAAGYVLYGLGWYPGMVHTPGDGGQVQGELYTLPEAGRAARLAAMDDYEGVPDPYQRAQVPLADGRTAVAWLLGAGHARGRPRIPGRDWRAWR